MAFEAHNRPEGWVGLVCVYHYWDHEPTDAEKSAALAKVIEFVAKDPALDCDSEIDVDKEDSE